MKCSEITEWDANVQNTADVIFAYNLSFKEININFS